VSRRLPLQQHDQNVALLDLAEVGRLAIRGEDAALYLDAAAAGRQILDRHADHCRTGVDGGGPCVPDRRALMECCRIGAQIEGIAACALRHPVHRQPHLGGLLAHGIGRQQKPALFLSGEVIGTRLQAGHALQNRQGIDALDFGLGGQSHDGRAIAQGAAVVIVPIGPGLPPASGWRGAFLKASAARV